MQVALYFGSFNPIHLGHVAIAQAVLQQTTSDELWFIVSPHNPLKDKNSLLGENERLQLVKLAIANEKNMLASSIEFSLERPSFTYKTMEALKEQYPNYSFSIVMGGDSFASITKWKNYKDLLAKNDIILYKRDNANIDHKLSNRLNILNVPYLNISATAIRNRIKEQQPFRHLVSEAVWQELTEKEFYR